MQKTLVLKLGFVATGFAAVLAACSGGSISRLPGSGTGPQSALQRPVPFATGAEPRIRRNIAFATAKSSRIVPDKHTPLVAETFANIATGANDWIYYESTCLTAGASPPPGSIPPCGSLAPQDPPGSGALQLTQYKTFTMGLVGWSAPLSTAKGLDVRFTLYDFHAGGNEEGSDGSLLYFSDGAKTAPKQPIGEGGCLGYFWLATWCEGPGNPGDGLANAYLGVGFDEYGNFSQFLAGGPGIIPNSVALGGAVSTAYHYLGGVTDGAGHPASLPFALGTTSSERPKKAPTVDVSLTSAGLLEVSINVHDGHGFVTYLSKNIVGIGGQPSVPSTVYVGYIGSCGAGDDIHQLNDFTITTLK